MHVSKWLNCTYKIPSDHLVLKTYAYLHGAGRPAFSNLCHWLSISIQEYDTETY